MSPAFKTQCVVYYTVPAGVFLRYTPWPGRKVSPYVRAGVKYPIGSGDNIESLQVGVFGAVRLNSGAVRR